MASGLLPKSPVSSSLCDKVPHIFIPISHLEPREFLISSAKRLLQQYLPKADSCTATKSGRSGACSGGRAKKLRFDAGAHGVAQLDSQIDLGERRDAVSVEIVPHAALHRQRRCHVAAGSIRRKARDNLQFAHFTSTISIQLAPFPTG